MRWLKNKGALLIALWNMLVTPVYYFLRYGLTGKQKLEDPLSISVNGIILLGVTVLYPIGGWLADAHLGRYKVVHYSMWIMWIGVILITFGEVLANFSVVYTSNVRLWLFHVVSVIILIGFGGFSSNIFQLGVDQLIDASADEISSYILWYVLGIYASALSLHFLSGCLPTERNMFLALTVAVCLTMVLCSDFICKQWLVKEEVTGKSLSGLWKIIKYIFKNRGRRYSLTDNDSNELTSLFDIAKHRYGGPFTSQQVDNVRTFLRIIIILATCGVVLGAIMPIEYAREKIQHRWDGYNEVYGSYMGCYKKLIVRYEDYIFIVVLILLYEFFMRPVFYRYLPHGSIISRFIAGTALFLLWIMSLLAIESYAYNRLLGVTSNNSIACIFHEPDNPMVKLNQAWFLIPDFFSGAARILLYVTAVEFIWAQTPSTMKGLMFGTAYAILGLNSILQSVIALPFLFNITTWNWQPLTCEIWYFILEGATVLAVLMIIIALVKRHKRRF